MCGIVGFIYFNQHRKADSCLTKKMADVIAHRGPDAEGFFTNNNISLGHRRLSIIDLATGEQPMFNDNKQLSIVFNGEIYNYIELRDELRKLGHSFKTNSDTEVILKAYEQWGTDCQQKFNGMWAFALWDEKKQQLFLSRDRIGEKPLHYYYSKDEFVFGSEIKSLLAYNIPPQPNYSMLEVYLSLGYIPAPHTFYKNIFKLNPGHYLLIKDGNVKELPYWELPQVKESEMNTNAKEVYDEFAHLLEDSVRIRMRCDVPFGAFLSGGLDSSTIVALMSKYSKQAVNTFTIGFKEKKYDERALAASVAAMYNTDHFLYEVVQDSFEESLQKVLFHYDEPFGDSSAIPTNYVSRFTRQKVKMALTGDGGDEVLSGYTSYQGEKFAGQYQNLPIFIQKLVPSAVQNISHLFSGSLRYKLNRIQNVSYTASLPFNQRLISKCLWTKLDYIKEFTKPYNEVVSIEDYMADVLGKCQFTDPFYKLMYFHYKVSLPDDMLVKVDRMSMANSLETRVPFLDYRLIEMMAKVHKDVKMQGYERKSVLRKALGNKLPTSILNAPKQGFNVPLREWFKGNSFEAKLESLYTSEWGMNKQIIKEIVSQNKQGQSDQGNFIWMLFVLKGWLKG